MRSSFATLTAAAVLVACTTAGAAVVRQLDLKQLSALAHVVVEGRVQSVEAKWVEGRIFREVTVVADRVVKGPYKAGQPVTLWAPGGEVGDLGQWVAGSPEFVVGERTLLFLEARPVGYVVAGLALGKLRTEVDDAGAAWVVRDPVPGLSAQPLRVSWSQLEGTVRASK